MGKDWGDWAREQQRQRIFLKRFLVQTACEVAVAPKYTGLPKDEGGLLLWVNSGCGCVCGLLG